MHGRTPDKLVDREDAWYGPYGARPGMERSDDDIRSDILANLSGDVRVDTSAIMLLVNSGVVTLSGEAGSEPARRAAEEDVWDVPGVVDVHNNLQVETDQQLSSR
jgi:osmotically-inducible protein OsmY